MAIPPLPLAVVAGGVLLLLDRLTKTVVASWLPIGGERRMFAGVRVRYVRHRLRPRVVQRQRYALPLLLGAAGLALGLFLGWSPLFQAPAAAAGIGIALAGATSNLWDRLQHHAFVDFLCIGGWPPFNVADVGVCLGAALALLNVAGA